MRGFWRFWSMAFRQAFTKGWTAVGVIGTIFSIVAPFLRHLDPKPDDHQAFWTAFDHSGIAWISILLFWLVVVARLMWGPYVLYKEVATKLELFDTRRPIFRIFSARIPVRPEIWPSYPPGSTNPPLAVVTFDLSFWNAGGGTAHHGQFIIHYCWLSELSKIMENKSAVSMGETMPSEYFGWRFAASQSAKLVNPVKNEWWFDQDGLAMLVEIEFKTDPATGDAGANTFWLHWSPYSDHLNLAGKEMVEAIQPHIERYKQTQREAIASGSVPGSITQPSSRPDAAPTPRSPS